MQILGTSFNDGAAGLVGAFNAQYVKGFPSGTAERGAVLEFLEHSVMAPFYVPIIAIVDRKGMVREQHIGDDDFLRDPEKNIRERLDALAKEQPMHTAAARSTIHRAAAKKK